MAAPAGDGRFVFVFGPPGVGVSLLIRILHEESTTKTVVVPGDRASIEAARPAFGVRPAFRAALVDGFPRSPEDVQWLVDQRLVTAAEGALIRIAADHEAVSARLAASGRQSPPDWGPFHLQLGALEECVATHDLAYFVVRNDGLESGVLQLAVRSRIWS